MSRKNGQARRFAFTHYGEDSLQWDPTTMGYLCYQRETCPTTQRKHWQGYVEMLKKRTIGGMSKILQCHWEICGGSGAQNRSYCSKSDTSDEGTWMEHGKLMQQGERGDLKALAERVLGGESVDSIAEEHPNMFHSYGRTLERLETIARSKRSRTHQTFITWIYGTTGTGKSRSLEKRIADEGRSIEKAYWHPVHDKHWWDNYTQQEDVILDDFRGEIPFQYLLNLGDWHTCHVSRRCQRPIPFVSKHIWITSSMHPRDVYKAVCTDANRLEQLTRRCREIVQMGDYPIFEHNTKVRADTEEDEKKYELVE